MAWSRKRIGWTGSGLSAAAAGVMAFLADWLLVIAFVATAFIFMALAAVQRRARGEAPEQIIARAMAGLYAVCEDRTLQRKPMTPWVVAGAHLGKLVAQGRAVDAATRAEAADCIARMADATFGGPHGRRNVTYGVVERMLDAYQLAGQMLPEHGGLKQTLGEHLWVDGSMAPTVPALVVGMKAGLRADEGAKPFDPPVFKRRVAAALR